MHAAPLKGGQPASILIRFIRRRFVFVRGSSFSSVVVLSFIWHCIFARRRPRRGLKPTYRPRGGLKRTYRPRRCLKPTYRPRRGLKPTYRPRKGSGNRNTEQERVWKPDYIILKGSLKVSWDPECRTLKGLEPRMQNQKGSGNRSTEPYRVLENGEKSSKTTGDGQNYARRFQTPSGSFQ